LQGSFVSNFYLRITITGVSTTCGFKVDNVSLKEVLPDSPHPFVDGNLATESLIGKGLAI